MLAMYHESIFSLFHVDMLSIEVIDVTGRLLMHKIINNLQIQEEISLDGSGLSSGVYFVHLVGEGRNLSNEKIIVY